MDLSRIRLARWSVSLGRVLLPRDQLDLLDAFEVTREIIDMKKRLKELVGLKTAASRTPALEKNKPE